MRGPTVKLWPWSRRDLGDPGDQLVPSRPTGSTPANLSKQDALRNSVVWACLTLRAELVSTMPLDVIRTLSDGTIVEVPPPPVLIDPDPGDPNIQSTGMGIIDWLFTTQWELDLYGNTVALIGQRDILGRPITLIPQPIESVTIIKRQGQWIYRIGGKEYAPYDVWHERAYPIAGTPLGLSPIGCAALSLSNGIKASEFAARWFSNSAMPGGHLKNNGKVLKRREAQLVKESWKAAIQAGEVWVSGQDWDYTPYSAGDNAMTFLAQIGASNADACRYLGVPGDMVDVPVNGSSITYANITQRNLQFLITKLGPALRRRETAFSRYLVAAPRTVRFDTNALLRMDMAGRFAAYAIGVTNRFILPSQIRGWEGWAPFTPDDLTEFATLFPSKAPAPLAPQGGPQT